MPVRMSDECLGVVKGVPGGQGNVFWVLVGVLECPGVFFGCWRVYGGLRRCLIVFFPLISFNFRKPRGMFPRVFGDEFGDKFGDEFGDKFSELPNLVIILVMNLVMNLVNCQIR